MLSAVLAFFSTQITFSLFVDCISDRRDAHSVVFIKSKREKFCILSVNLFALAYQKTDDGTPLLKQNGNSQKISLRTKLAFGAGACPSALANTVIGFYFNAFLLEVAGV